MSAYWNASLVQLMWAVRVRSTVVYIASTSSVGVRESRHNALLVIVRMSTSRIPNVEQAPGTPRAGTA